MAISKITTGSISDSVAIDTDTLVVDGTNNRVGIGTTSFTNKLHAESAGANYIVSRDSTSGGTAGVILQNGSDTRGIRISGSSLQLHDHSANLTRLSVDSSGRVTMPYQPSFRAGGAPAPSAGNEYVNYPTVNHNIGSHFNATNGRFTAPVAGRYLFVLTVGNNSSFGVDLMLNGGSTICRIEFINPPAFTWQTGALVMQLSANDFVVAKVFTGTASMSAGQGNFSGHLLG